MKQNVYFVSGIDTDAGKSYATGFLGRSVSCRYGILKRSAWYRSLNGS